MGHCCRMVGIRSFVAVQCAEWAERKEDAIKEMVVLVSCE